MCDSLPWTPMNHRAKCDAASFILGGEIRIRTNTQTVNDISHLAYWHLWIISRTYGTVERRDAVQYGMAHDAWPHSIFRLATPQCREIRLCRPIYRYSTAKQSMTLSCLSIKRTKLLSTRFARHEINIV